MGRVFSFFFSLLLTPFVSHISSSSSHHLHRPCSLQQRNTHRQRPLFSPGGVLTPPRTPRRLRRRLRRRPGGRFFRRKDRRQKESSQGKRRRRTCREIPEKNPDAKIISLGIGDTTVRFYARRTTTKSAFFFFVGVSRFYPFDYVSRNRCDFELVFSSSGARSPPAVSSSPHNRNQSQHRSFLAWQMRRWR